MNREKNNVKIMGILNVTPDSFSDGGQWNNVDAALRRVETMIEEGASIIDVGGESTRPGYTKVSSDEEILRVVPVIEGIKREFNITISIDTQKAVVAEEAVKAGARMINDIWGLKGDEDMATVARKYDVYCCIMHNRNNVLHPYNNLVENVISDLQESIDIATKVGISRDKLIVDPGIGFGKSYEDNLKLLNNLSELKRLGCPILLAASRKSVIGLALDLPVEERLEGTIATTIMGVTQGCSIVRVHDIKENFRAIKMVETIMRSKN